MRVAQVAMETVHGHDSAGARRFDRVGHELAAEGHDVTVFCARWWDGDADEWTDDGVEYRGVAPGGAVPSFCTRLPALLARHRPDVVHVRPAPAQQVVAASVGGSLARAPLVLDWYGDEGLSPENRWTRWALSRPDCIVTPSEYVRTAVRAVGADGEAVRVIPEGIDYSLVESTGPAEAVDVVYAHQFDGSSNLEDLLLGLAELRDRDWTATVIGDGPHREEHEQQAADLRIADRVDFPGECSRERRVAAYRGAHVFVQTASREQFATELLWALACGCIGVVEYQAESSAHELIENYDRGNRVTDPQGLADAIADAGAFERRAEDDAWRSHDHSAIVERYLAAYGDPPAPAGRR